MTSGTSSVPGSAELPRPRFEVADARRLLATVYGIRDVDPVELGSQQDRNFLVTHDGDRFVLKIANSTWPRDALAAQDDAMIELAGAPLRLEVPAPAGSPTAVTIDGAEHVVRLLTFVEGRPLAQWGHLATPVVVALGTTAAEMTLALKDFSHRGLDRWVQWDLRRAREVVTALLPYVRDAALRDRVRAETQNACDRLDTLAGRLPVQPIHGDLTDDNLVAAAGPDGRPMVTGVIDFGDLALGWRVAELAVAAGCALHHEDSGPMTLLPAVRAFHERAPLSDAEIEALWPLVVARSAVLVVSGLGQLAIDPLNAYAASGAVRERAMFDVATAVPVDVAHAAVRASLGLTPPARLPPPGALVDCTRSAILDLSVTSALLDAGLWTEAGATEQLVREAGGEVVLRHGEPRLIGSPPLSSTAPNTISLAATYRSAEGTDVHAPWDVNIDMTGDRVRLTGEDWTVLLGGVSSPATDRAAAGEVLGRVPAGGVLEVWLLTTDLGGELPPSCTTADLAPGWLAVCIDPSSLLGLPPGAASFPRRRSPTELMTQRRAVVPAAQERYYGEVPPQFERGWRELMLDVHGRSYVDTVNNVTMVGHGDPEIAAASARQWLLLNTNSRFHYEAIVDYSARLASLFPAELDTVFLVNSGSEAVDLALHLAKVHTGRADVVAISEAYHGWTEGADAVSTSLHDNPRAAQSRPSWVHPVLAPNTFRGEHRGEDAAEAYRRDVRDTVAHLASRGLAPAAFICEAVYGKEGALMLPDGYLTAAYAAVREHGGLAIADEVQVGFGRLGEFLWGYQQQQVVPDIVTVAKAVGNGHPLGAVITRRAVADSLDRDGIFFSSAGGSAVSAAVGLKVLEIWHRDRLQDNARDVGAHLRARFERLADMLRDSALPAAAAHGLFIGAVHGLGLYQGVELVRDLRSLEPATEETLALCERVLDLGVIMQPTGENFNILKVKPPLCMSIEAADHFVDALTHALASGW